MATIIWCDKIKHIVIESRGEVAGLIDRVHQGMANHDLRDMEPRGFAYFTVKRSGLLNGNKQIALNVSLISSFEARGDDRI